jgi:hypothetical protein
VATLKGKSLSVLVMWAACLTLAGLLISHQLIYRQFLLPRLSEFSSVPLGWWAAIFAPLGMFVIAIGFLAENFKQSLLSIGISTAAVQGYIWISALLDQPGLTKSLATEAPDLFWFQGTIVVLVIIAIFISMGMLSKRVWIQRMLHLRRS